jgi:hypothetical protein
VGASVKRAESAGVLYASEISPFFSGGSATVGVIDGREALTRSARMQPRLSRDHSARVMDARDAFRVCFLIETRE